MVRLGPPHFATGFMLTERATSDREQAVLSGSASVSRVFPCFSGENCRLKAIEFVFFRVFRHHGGMTPPSSNTSASDLAATDPEASPENYREALLAVRDSSTRETLDKYVRVLKLQHAQEDQAITVAGLSEGLKLASANAGNLLYGKLAKAMAGHLDFTPPNRTNGNKQPMWWLVLSTGESEEDDRQGDFVFTMRPELKEALEAMKWVKSG